MNSIIASLLGVLGAAAVAAGLFAWLAYQFGKRRTHRSAGELSTLNEIGTALLRARLNVDELTELVYEQAREIVPSPMFQIGLFEDDAYHVKVWVRDGERLPPTVFPLGGRKGIVGWVRASGEPLVVQNYQEQRDELPAFPEFEIEDPPCSGLFVPLIAGDSTLGVLAVQSQIPRRFNDEHLRLFTALANLAASAIRHAQLYEQARHRAEQLNLIAQITTQISTMQALPDLLEQVVGLLEEAFGYYAVAIFLYKDGRLRVGASTGNVYQQHLPEFDPSLGMIGWAARNGEAAVANNVGQDPRYYRLGVLPETRGEVAVPLKIEDRVLGVLDVQSNQTDSFGPDAVSLLETLAAQIALAVEQAESYAAERDLAQKLEALVQASQAVASILDLDELLERVAELIGDTFGFERVHIFISIGELLVFRAGIGPHSVRWLIDELTYHISDAEGLIPFAARSGQALMVDDVRESEQYRPGAGLEDTRSEMVVPIQMAGHVLGVLDLQSERPAAFSADDLVLMQSLADSVAVAIRNAALYASERRRRHMADTLRVVSGTLAAELELDDVITGALQGMRQLTSPDAAGIFLIDEDGAGLTAYITTGEGMMGYAGRRVPLDAIHFGEEESILARVRDVYHEMLGQDADAPLITVPLAVAGSLIGYMVAGQSVEWLHGTPDLEVVSALANQTAVAISNARLYASQQAEAYVTTVLLQVAEAVNAQAEASEGLDTIARLTALLAGVGRCLILHWQPATRCYHLVSQYGITREQFKAEAEHAIPAADHPLLDLLSVTNNRLGAGRGYELEIPAPLARLLPTPRIQAFPLHAKSGPVGLLVVDEPSASSPRLMSILEGIAHQTATVLEAINLQASAVERRRLEQELAVARSIQASFIPDVPPAEPGWELAAVWRAARQVSGDFYDFIPLADGRWGLAIADVADKGMPAALFMAVCRTLLRAAANTRVSPAETLARVNELLFNDARSDLFVTLFYAVWDPSARTLSYASGGHNPALLWRQRDGELRELDARGIALGVIESVDLEQETIELAEGDMVIGYTDGLTEAMQADYTEWGLDRLKETLLGSAARSAGEVLDTVLAAVDEFVGDAPQNDDLTMWMLRFTDGEAGERGE